MKKRAVIWSSFMVVMLFGVFTMFVKAQTTTTYYLNNRNELFQGAPANSNCGEIAACIKTTTGITGSIAKTEGENAFYMLDSTVLAKTGVLSKVGSKISTGAKIGLPILGAVIDYKTLKENGESTKDALIKTGVHAVIGQAGGKLGTIAGLAITARDTILQPDGRQNGKVF